MTDVKQGAKPGTSSLGKRQHNSSRSGNAKKQKIWYVFITSRIAIMHIADWLLITIRSY